MRPGKHIANFDSSASMLYAVADYLKGKNHPNLGTAPNVLTPLLTRLAAGVNRLPERARAEIFTLSGGTETISSNKLRQVRSEDMAAFAAGRYPRRRYQAAMLGSTNGAAVHLCTALGIPWLPQTFLIPVRRLGLNPNEPLQEADWAIEPGRNLLDANPDLQLHNMLDPVQDLLMSRVLAYFRVKFLRMPQAYERFLVDNLEPGATIFLLECDIKWPTTMLTERHIFQFGALGGATRKEFMEGGPRVEEFLRRYGSYRRKWDPPEPDGDRPEAEWGFAPEMRESVEAFAARNGFRVRRIVYDMPENLSPLVADLYRWWHERRGLVSNRLLVECFIILEPYWTMRLGAVPFWVVFSTEPFDSSLEWYLEHRPPFDDIGVTLFPHGVNSIGLAPPRSWQRILDRALRKGVFVGVNVEKFPLDVEVLTRYQTDLKMLFKSRYPIPGPLSLSRFDEFLEERRDEYEVRWE